MAEIGWVNRAFDTKEEMEEYVDAVASRIALFPRGGIQATKKGIIEGFGPRPGSIADDVARFSTLLASDAAQGLLDKWLQLSQNQSRGWFELHTDDDLVQLYH